MPKDDAKSGPTTKKQKTLHADVAPAAPTTVSSPATSTNSTTASPQLADKKAIVNADDDEFGQDKEMDGQEELSAADSFSKDDPDYSTKVAAEEDKRRRNTAASARFRQKKKLREQALEQTAKEQTTRAEVLEARVRDLEMEVRWLRGLIVEKDSRLHEATVSLHGR
ncbi:hypothetical protein EDD21DRAFT_311025 [Dissophora ornata]|nr:hypothetical protein EDD21DRAFT_311025 [Dissophora ornata]